MGIRFLDEEAPQPQQPQSSGSIRFLDEAPQQAPVQQANNMEVIKSRLTKPVVTPASVFETGLGMVSGAAASAVGGLAGLGTLAFTGNADKAADVSKSIQSAGTYEPRTEAGKALTGMVSAPFEAINEGLGYVGGRVGQAMGNEAAGQTVGEASFPIMATLFGLRTPVKNIATTPYTGTGAASASKLLENARASSETALRPLVAERNSKKIEGIQQNAQKIEAAKAAEELGIKINPATVNPNKTNNLKSSLAGGSTSVDAALALENLNVNVPRVVRKELGLTEDVVLTAQVFDDVLARAGESATAISALPAIPATFEAVTSLQKLKPGKIIGKDAEVAAVTALLDEAIDGITSGVSGKNVIDSIRQNRTDARAILKNPEVSAIDRAKAKASLGIANTLENMVEQHLAKTGDQGLLTAFKEGRVIQAKAYTWKDAFNADTGRFDPRVIAKQTSGDSAITGDTAKIGKIANNFPDALAAPSSSQLQRMTDALKTHYNRAGPLGIAGGITGGLIGGPIGFATGAGIGAAVGEVLAPMATRSIKNTKKYVPEDSSLVSPYSTKPGTAVVPYKFEGEVVDGMPYKPNFTAGRPDPIITPTGPDMSTPQLGYRSSRDAVLEKEAARNAAAKAADEAAATADSQRTPTRGRLGGDNLVFDVNGKLIPESSQGVGGVVGGLSSLEAAVDKIAGTRGMPSPRKFDLTATEKIAFDKARSGVEAIGPDYRGLTDKQLANKMADRDWVESAMKKAQQKADAFAKYEATATDAAQRRKAKIEREKLIDLVEDLQDKLGSRPSMRGYEQGEKTRKFQRGLLEPGEM